MNSRRSPLHCKLAGILAVCLTLSPIGFVANAEERTEPQVPGAPHLLPEDTLAYIRLDSADELRGDLANSSIGRMFNDPKLKPFVSDVYQTMAELFAEFAAVTGISLDDLLAIPRGQVAVAAMPGNISEREEELIRADAEDDDSPEAIRRRIALKRRQQNAIAGLFLVEAGDHVDDLLGLVEKLEALIIQGGYVRRTSAIKGTTLIRLLPPRQGRPEIEYFEKDDTVVFGIGHQTASKVLDQWLDRSDEPTLAQRNDFATVMSRCVGAEETRPQLTFFIDPYHLVERLVKRGGAAALVWPIIEELGISKIRGIGGSAFRGGDVFDDISHLHVLIDPPRDGFFGVLRPQTGETLPPNWVPADVSSYTSIHWDFETTYDNLDKVIAKFQGADPLKRLVEQPAKTALGISIRDEVLSNLTGRYVGCRWIEPPIKLNSQVQLHALKVNDSLAAKNLIAKFRERRPNDVRVETIGGHIVYFGRQPRRNNLPKGFRQPEPCFTVLGDWAIFSDSRAFIERVTRANRAGMPRLVNEPEYELVSSELGGKLAGEKPFLVSFLRSSDYIRQVYQLIQSEDTRRFVRTQGEKNPVAGKIWALLQRNELPPFDELKKYFAPSGTFAYDEPSGMHLGSFTLRAED